LVVSLGAMSLGSQDVLESASLFVDAVQQSGLRAIVQGWEKGLVKLSLPSTISVAGSMPHRWLLPRSAGVVHHGGSGTTAAGLRAGIPHLVIPHIADQFFWGQRVHKLGVGLRAIRRTQLTARRLATALEELVRNNELRSAASLLGEQIRAENGVDSAVSLIEETFAPERIDDHPIWR
jgi:sterol 3beta-glucosyltransferase